MDSLPGSATAPGHGGFAGCCVGPVVSPTQARVRGGKGPTTPADFTAKLGCLVKLTCVTDVLKLVMGLQGAADDFKMVLTSIYVDAPPTKALLRAHQCCCIAVE